MPLTPGPLDPAGASAAEYESLPREEQRDARRLCPWVPTPLAVVDPAVRLAGISRRDFVIDLGCGNGEVLMRMTAQTGCRCQGMDICPSLIAAARRRAAQRGMDASRATFEVADFCASGFALPQGVSRAQLRALKPS